MRCKKHTFDHSSGGGVCASCLRERLLYLIAAQEQAQRASVEDRRKFDPPPLIFPRSVSPYVSRRKSDASAAPPWPHNHHRFFSTPQVGPTHSSAQTATDFAASRSYNKKKGRFTLFSKLFRVRSDKLDTDPHRDDYEDHSSSPFSTWFSSIFPSRRKKQQSRTFYAEESNYGDRRNCGVVDRGMSPVRIEDNDRSPYASTEPSPRWRRTPISARRCKAAQGPGRSVSGLSFCLSPLVRVSPNRSWSQGLPPELAYSGEIRSPAKPYLSTATSFCKNRSIKLADFGRVNPNR